MTLDLSLAPPNMLGAPEKFSAWRPVQLDAIQRHLNSPKRFVMSDMPTGSGKSLMYVMTAVLSGQRTVIATSTKGLQDQLIREFQEIGMEEIRGANAYSCLGLSRGLFGDERSGSCDEGPCRFKVPCPLRKDGCLYFDQVTKASDADLVVTNYAYWMSMQEYGVGLGKFDRLVLDEAHDAVDWLCSFVSKEITGRELGLVDERIPKLSDLASWRKWATAVAKKVQGRIKRLEDAIDLEGQPDMRILKEKSILETLHIKLSTMSVLNHDWIVESGGGVVKASVIWPAKYAEQYLFRGVPHVDFVSATVQPKTAELLGIAESNLDFRSYPSDFPAKRRLVIHVPTVRMNHRNTSEHENKWLAQVDDIVGDRLDRKGIIHTVSYKRRDLIIQRTRHRSVMIHHTPSTTGSAFYEFKRSEPPAVLVSPSATTGWDFPRRECEYQIIVKLPYPDLSSAVMQARSRTDKDYGAYMCAQTLVQMVGRGMRDREDQCETLVLDDNIRWFLGQYRRFFPEWFLEACTRVTVRAVPPPRL